MKLILGNFFFFSYRIYFIDEQKQAAHKIKTTRFVRSYITVNNLGF